MYALEIGLMIDWPLGVEKQGRDYLPSSLIVILYDTLSPRTLALSTLRFPLWYNTLIYVRMGPDIPTVSCFGLYIPEYDGLDKMHTQQKLDVETSVSYGFGLWLAQS
jgi:hypothetical protein